MEDPAHQHLSTSALAKQLGIPSQQVFTTLKDYAWIRKVEDGWSLTSKGEFEGGEYVHRKRYGRYIVWPTELATHPLFKAMEDNQTVTARILGKPYGLTARQVNRLLAELGWIKHGFQGWELTVLGEGYGGTQMENDNGGTFYVVWPSAISGDSLLVRQLQSAAVNESDDSAGAESDLFSGSKGFTAFDGHEHNSEALMQVCQWLYLAGLGHACKRQLPTAEKLYADFYLPSHQLYIECWSGQESAAELRARMRRKELYKELSMTVIDVEKDDFGNLDELLTRKFRKLGIRVY
jgi:hypothetical protein